MGHFYVEFEKLFAAEYKKWCEGDEAKAEFEKWKASSGGKTALSKNQKYVIILLIFPRLIILREREKILAAANKEKDEEKKKALLASLPDDLKTWKDDQKNYYLNHFSPLGKSANEMLVKWEEGDAEVRALWKQMNAWVFEGFSQTYKVSFFWLFPFCF